VKPVEGDRSVKNIGANVIGQLTKSPVAVGAQLMAYSGFSPANYLEQPYSANLDVGTGDFCVMGWAKPSGAGYEYICERAPVGDLSTPRIELFTNAGALSAFVKGATSAANLTPVNALSTAAHSLVMLVMRAGTLELWANSTLLGTVNASGIGSVSNAAAVLRVGARPTSSTSQFGGSLALVRFMATAPSADQIRQIYQDELALFQPGAQCTLRGTSNAVLGVASS
jgi:hypothetical protein